LRRLLLDNERRPARRFRAACALAFLDPRNDWARWGELVANELVKEDLPSAQKWSRRLIMMSEGSSALYVSLKNVYLDPVRPDSERPPAATLMRFTADTYPPSPDASLGKELMDLLLEVEGAPYEVLSPWFLANGLSAAKLVQGELDRPSPADP